MTTPAFPDRAPSQSAIANAFRILHHQGLFRQMLVVLGVIGLGVLDGLAISGLLPVLTIISGNADKPPGRTEKTFLDILDFIGIVPTLGSLALFLCALAIGKAVLTLNVNRYIGSMVAEIATDLRSQLTNSLLAARWSYFTVNPVGRFAASITAEAAAASLIYRTSLNLVAAAIQAVVFAAIALLIDWRVGLVGIAVALFVGLSMRFLIRRSRRFANEQLLATRWIVSELNDVAQGFKPIKAMHRHAGLMRELRKEAKSMRRSMRELVLLEQLAEQLPDLVTTAMLVLVAFVALSFFAMPAPEFLISIFLIYNLSRYIAKVQKAARESVQAEVAYSSVAGLIRETEAAAEHFKGSETPSLRSACRFSDVHFSYGRSPVLEGVTLEIPAGRITTLVGESGSGKTTIADLLLGLFLPQRGEITLDGVPLDRLDIAKWRGMVGYVPQEILLFNDTILANVTLGDPAIAEADVMEALELADAMGFVAELPDGLFTRVGDRGALLSGGQRQRIALARALVARPALLILDEATSALDPASEAEICAAVFRQRGRLTVLAITHQPAWVELADRVYSLERGQVRRLEEDERRLYLPAAAGATAPARIS